MNKYYFVMYNIFVWKIEKLLNTIFKECLFFVFCLICFLLLSGNTLHITFCTYICYWNTFQYKCIIQITFHVVKQSHARVTWKDISLSHYFFAYSRFVSTLFYEALLLLLKFLSLVFVLKWYIIHCLIYFGFIECLYMHLLCQVFGRNSRVIQNWVTNLSYGWLSFVKKIHAMSLASNSTTRRSKQESLRLRESAIALTLSLRVWGSRVSTSSFFTP